MAEGKIQIPWVPLLLGGGGLLLVYKGGSALGKKFGIIKDDELQNTISQLQGIKEMNPNYINSLGGKKYMAFVSASSVPDIAKKLYDAKGFFHDDTSGLWAALNRLQYRTHLAQVSNYFSKKYSKDLADYLQTFLNAEELNRVITYFKGIPSGMV